MVIVYNTDMYKYIDKQRKVESVKYSNGVKKIYENETVYLRKRLYDGDGIVGDIFNFISKNKDIIGSIASTASSVADSVKKISSNAIDVVRKIKELRHKPSITDDMMNTILNANDTPKTGN